MRVSKVIYKLFESDAKWLVTNPNHRFHCLDREILLQFEDSADRHISWQQTVSANDEIIFVIGCREASFFANEPPIVRNMSDHAFWRPLIGTEIELIRTDAEGMVLELRASDYSIFCAAYEEGNWGVDVVHISPVAPCFPA